MDIDPEAYQKDPEWQKLNKSAKRWRNALYITTGITVAIYILLTILALV